MQGQVPAYSDTGGASRFVKNCDWEHETYEQRKCPRCGGSGLDDSSMNPCPLCGGMGELPSKARFRYTAKASRAERNAGLEGFEERTKRILNGGIPSAVNSDPRGMSGGGDRQARNHHPTVKPVDLMRWLCRLVTPPEVDGKPGRILDPFCGSGTTGIAAILEGFDFVGVEREPEYVEISRARIAWWDTHKDRAEEILALSSKSERERAEHEAAGQMGLEVEPK